MSSPRPPRRIRVRRKPDPAAYDRETINQVLDEALTCTVAFVRDGGPVAIPMIHARSKDTLYLHGSTVAGFAKDLQPRTPVCVSVSIVDGIVLARSGFNHSLNYRSVVVFGDAHPVEGDGKLSALEAIVEHITPGRWASLRPPTDEELRETSVLAVPISEASAKVRTGGTKESGEDTTFPVWAGVLPLHLRAGEPIAATDLPEGLDVPDGLRNWRRPHR
jgi:uncharacterized protein